MMMKIKTEICRCICNNSQLVD